VVLEDRQVSDIMVTVVVEVVLQVYLHIETLSGLAL